MNKGMFRERSYGHVPEQACSGNVAELFREFLGNVERLVGVLQRQRSQFIIYLPLFLILTPEHPEHPPQREHTQTRRQLIRVRETNPTSETSIRLRQKPLLFLSLDTSRPVRPSSSVKNKKISMYHSEIIWPG